MKKEIIGEKLEKINYSGTVNFLEWIKSILIALIIALIILFFVRPVIVHKQSMEPTFSSGDYVFVSTQSYKLFGQPKLGDVVVFKTGTFDAEGKEQCYIKRIIGTPGDTVKIVDGEVLINGERIEEPYLKEQFASGEMEKKIIPDGKLFVMGDNRGYSLDSRSAQVGFVDISSIVGKVIIRVYPFNKIALF